MSDVASEVQIQDEHRLAANRQRIRRWRETGLPADRLREVIDDLRVQVANGPTRRCGDETLEQYRDRVSGWYRVTKGLLKYAEEVSQAR